MEHPLNKSVDEDLHCNNFMGVYIGGHIPPTLWATGGLDVVSIKLPLSLPSPRASDPAPLEVPRANIAFAKQYELLSERLQKCTAD